MKRAAIYCRVSTEQELQEGSFELQREYYLQKVENDPNLTLAGVYGDFGRSGTSIKKRPELQRLLRDCEAGKVDVILTKSISRFARNVADCVEMIRKLKSFGVSVVFEKENINTAEPLSEMLLTILATMAEEEVHSLSQNIRWSQEESCTAGQPWFRCSYGYNKKNGRAWVIDEKEAERVRMAFRMAAQGVLFPEIQCALNACEKKHGSQDRWSLNRIRYLLRNVVYIGDLITWKYYTNGPGLKLQVNHGEHAQYYIENHHPPIISRAEFERVQTMLASGLLRSNRHKKLRAREKEFIHDESWKEEAADGSC